MKPLIAVLLFALPLAAGQALGQTVYRWVDDQGVTHFSSTPPEHGQAEEIRLQAPPGMDGEPDQQIDVPVEPEPGAADSAAAIRDRNCVTARNNLALLETTDVALRQDPETGESVEIRGAELQAAINETLQQIREFCLPAPGS